MALIVKPKPNPNHRHHRHHRQSQEQSSSNNKSTTSEERSRTKPSPHIEGGMDYERWVNQHMDLLKMKSMTTSLATSRVPLPKRLAEKMFKIDVDEMNSKGETLMIAVVKYIADDLRQVQFLNILIRMGADVNLGDTKNQRTPIMHAALYKRTSAVRALVNHPQLRLGIKDRLGNTALMYAALQGEKMIIDLLAIRLSRSWSFDVFLDKNQKGSTAENMAVSNQKYLVADILKSTRVRMLQRMHKQLALIHYSAELRGWKGYTAAYRAAKIWQSKKLRRRQTASLPILNDLGEKWNLLHLHDIVNNHHHSHDRSIDHDHDQHHHQFSLLAPWRPRARSCMVLKSHGGKTSDDDHHREEKVEFQRLPKID